MQSVSLGRVRVKLPQLEGFASASQENARFASAMAAMVPSDAKLLTCWVDAGEWKRLLAGQGTSTYPALLLTQAQVLPRDWTAADFAQLKELASTQFKGTSAASTREQVAKEDRNLAKLGVDARREQPSVSYLGIFDSSKDSFSYFTGKSVRVVANGRALDVTEKVATTNLFYAGQVIALTVIEKDATSRSAERVMGLTKAWMAAFREANSRQ